MSFNESQSTYCGTGVDNFYTSYKNWHGYISLIVCTLGTGANILNIIVLTRKDMRSSTNAILTGLAVADLTVMLEYIPYTVHDYILIENLPREQRLSFTWACFIKFHSIFTQVLHTISIWLTVTLAIWRFIAVAYPQKNRQWCNIQTTLITIISAYIVCILIVTPSLYLVTAIAEFYETLDRNGKTLASIPLSQYIIDYQQSLLNTTTKKMSDLTQKKHQDLFKNKLTFNQTIDYGPTIFNNATIMPTMNSNTSDDDFTRNITVYRLYHSDLALRNKSIQHITFLIYSVLIKLIPCIALTILSIRLIMALLKAKRRRKKLTNNFRNTIKTMMSNGGKMLSISTASGSLSEPKTNVTTTTTTTTTTTMTAAALTTAKATTTTLTTTMPMAKAKVKAKKQHQHKQNNLMEKEKQTDRTTRMLLAVLLLFLITEFPQGIMGLLNLILGDAFLMECYLKFSDLMDILALINSSINFILYCSMSRQFRTTFVLLFRPKFFDKWTPVAQDDDTRIQDDCRWNVADGNDANYKLNDITNYVNKTSNDNAKLLKKKYTSNTGMINKKIMGIGNQIATTTQATNV